MGFAVNRVKDQPHLGDTRKTDSRCDVCGKRLLEVYGEHPIYHNDFVTEWRIEAHDAPLDCIKYLAHEVERLWKR